MTWPVRIRASGEAGARGAAAVTSVAGGRAVDHDRGARQLDVLIAPAGDEDEQQERGERSHRGLRKGRYARLWWGRA